MNLQKDFRMPYLDENVAYVNPWSHSALCNMSTACNLIKKTICKRECDCSRTLQPKELKSSVNKLFNSTLPMNLQHLVTGLFTPAQKLKQALGRTGNVVGVCK